MQTMTIPQPTCIHVLSSCFHPVLIIFLNCIKISYLNICVRCRDTNIFTLYPYVHQSCNNKTFEDQIRPVHFPDINPSNLPEDADFSMAAGDFLEVYTEPGKYHTLGNKLNQLLTINGSKYILSSIGGVK